MVRWPAAFAFTFIGGPAYADAVGVFFSLAVGKFSTMFLNYDLLAKRWVPYSYIYPFAEGLAGVLMVAGALTWLSVPVALFIGTIGPWPSSE